VTRSILDWPHELPPSRITAHFVAEGEPASKQRARTTIKDGRASTYTPAATKEAEAAIHGYYLAGFRDQLGDETSKYGVRIFFYRKNRRRRDLDNMAKLVLDALNKMAWDDDTQIDELTLWRTYDVGRPRTEVLVYLVEA
jgi:Holliday junction resolvase RusA-like endonuclease